ncbi:hypothetical protein ScPMuIL_013941 [Solemya velum]
MVCQSCAIGACEEKTYEHSKDVKFFYLRNLKEEKRAWKLKIAKTRKDSESIGDHVAICNRHFVDGDKRNLPTIIPRKVNGEIIWPNQTPSRRIVIRKQLDFRELKSPQTSTETNRNDGSTISTPIAEKVERLKSLAESPAKELKECISKRERELQNLTPTEIEIYKQMRNSETANSKSPQLSKKLKILKEKGYREQAGLLFLVLVRQKEEKDLSHSHEVTPRVQPIWRRMNRQINKCLKGVLGEGIPLQRHKRSPVVVTDSAPDNGTPFTQTVHLHLYAKSVIVHQHFLREKETHRRMRHAIAQELKMGMTDKLKATQLISIMIDGATDHSILENEIEYFRFIDNRSPLGVSNTRGQTSDSTVDAKHLPKLWSGENHNGCSWQ